jgi:hypothetical protein
VLIGTTPAANVAYECSPLGGTGVHVEVARSPSVLINFGLCSRTGLQLRLENLEVIAVTNL